MVRECIQANVSAWKLDKNKEDDILAGSTSITELFSYLPRLYESCQTSLEVALASAPILPAGLFPIGLLRKEIQTPFVAYKVSMELIEKQSAEANLHLLFGRTEHFDRQQVITIMQPAIRSELNDWIERP